MVLDSQSAALPVPVEREVGGVRVRELRMLDYPYFVDARGEGLADGSAPTAGLHELTMSWASPIRLDRAALGERQAVELVTSSPAAWTAASTRSEEHTSELQSLMRISYAVFCLKKK